ncbi:7TMR-DISMED2 domain-containing protein, partial [Pseudomonas sp. HK3]
MLSFVASIVMLLTVMSVNASPLILANDGNYRVAPHIEYLQEDDDVIGIEQIQSPSQNWTKNKDDEINFGFTNHAYWLKFQVENHNVLNQEWALEIAYPILDNVDIYVINNNQQVISYFYGGDKVAVDDKFISHPNIVFPIDLFPYELTTVYARIESEGAIQVPIVFWEWDDFNFHTLVHFLFQGFFYGMVS